MKRVVLIAWLLSSTVISIAQELCDNGVDDDGDGLVDLNDPDCNCIGVPDRVTSLIPNPSFEDMVCCPSGISQMHCAERWIQASDATADYLNSCGLSHFGDYLPPPLPLPGNGQGYVGIANFMDYHEMVGACLNQPMKADSTYRISLYLAKGHATAPPLVISIFGTPDCHELPWQGEGCPVGTGSWTWLGSDTVEFTAAGWQQTVIEFTPTTDIRALAVGGPCGTIPQGLLNNYYYLDELMVASATEFDLHARIYESGKWCTGDLELHADIDTTGGSWQWYRSGVALPGETSDKLNLVVYGTDATYTARYALGDACISISHYVDTMDPANRPRELFISNRDTVVCAGRSVTVSAAATPGYHYQWSPTTGVSDPQSLTPEISVSRGPAIFYELTASYPGCPDTTVGFRIEPEWVEVDLGADTLVCRGDRIPIFSETKPHRSDYSYEWTPVASGLQLSNTPHNYFLSDSNITYTLEVFTPRGCSAKDSIHVDVREGAFAEATADTGFCPPASIPLWASGGESYHWEPAYGLSNVSVPDPVASPATPTLYTVYVTNAFGCRDTQQVFVDVYPLAVLHMPDTIRLYPGEQYHLEPATNCHYFSWFPNSGIHSSTAADPVFRPEVRTRYFVTARTEQGCTIKDSIDVLVEGTVIDMPNAFMPGRGVAPVFKPARRGIAELVEFSVYSRWGNKIFSTTDIDEGWDGNYKGHPQPPGVYVYQIEAITPSGQRFQKHGNVTLIR